MSSLDSWTSLTDTRLTTDQCDEKTLDTAELEEKPTHDTGSTCNSLLSLGTREEGNVLFNDALNTFYLRLYGVGHMVKDHSDSERRNLLPPHLWDQIDINPHKSKNPYGYRLIH